MICCISTARSADKTCICIPDMYRLHQIYDTVGVRCKLNENLDAYVFSLPLSLTDVTCP